MTSRRTFIKQLGAVAAAMAVTDAAARTSGKGSTDSMRLSMQKVDIDSSWDVIIIGGGPAGCTAAISAAREGARTLIIETMGQLGGMGTSGLVPAWTPFSDGQRMVYRGLAETVFNMAKKGVPHEKPDAMDWVSINPEHLMLVYDRLVSESGASVLFFSRVCRVEMSSDETIDAVIVANKSGLTAFKAKVFIDATGDGDVAAWAGCRYRRGYDGKGTNQLSTLCFEIANIDSYDYINGPQLYSDRVGTAVIDKAVESGKWKGIDRHFCNNFVGPDVLGLNAGHLSVDTLDPWQVSRAMMDGRKLAQEYLEAMKEMRPSTFGGSFVARTAAVLGVRDSRRVEGDYVLTGDDWRARRSFEDEIGRNNYFIDIHGGGTPPQHYKAGESHGLPYRCLTPKGKRNLLTAGRCISADSEVYGSTRIMPCCLVTGEAAGMAAKHAIDQTDGDVHGIDVGYLRKRLTEVGQYLL